MHAAKIATAVLAAAAFALLAGETTACRAAEADSAIEAPVEQTPPTEAPVSDAPLSETPPSDPSPGDQPSAESPLDSRADQPASAGGAPAAAPEPGHDQPSGIAEDGHGETVSGGFEVMDSIFILVLAGFVGFEVIRRVSPLLHTPLMSATNAISGISLVGSLVAAGNPDLGTVSNFLGFIAVTAATINVVGGFMITDRMLRMFKLRGKGA